MRPRADRRPSRTRTRAVLGDPCPDQLSHENRREWFIRRKPDRTFAGLVRLEIMLVDGDRMSAREERAVVARRRKPHQHPSVETECRNLVADALLGFRCGGANCSTELLECDALVGIEPGQIAVDSLRCLLHRD